MQCQAKSKRSGVQCKNPAVTGMRVCRIHGGATPVGIASPNFKHGKYSKYLPHDIVEKYEEAKNDPDLLGLNDEIAVVDARLKELLEKAGGQQTSTATWGELREAWKASLTAQANGDVSGRTAALNRVNDLIMGGVDTERTWRQITRLIDARRRLVATEAKRLVDMRAVITSERAMVLVYAILNIIKGQATEYKGRVIDDAFFTGIAFNVRKLIS